MRQYPNRLLRNLLICVLPILLATTAKAQIEIYGYFKQSTGTYLPGSLDGTDIDEPAAPAASIIPLQSISFSAENATTIGSGSGGAGTGVAKFGTMEFTKLIDKSSPAIFSILTTGAHLDTFVVVFRKTVNNQKVTFMRVEFKMAFFTSTSVGANTGDSDLNETVKVVYGAQRFTVYPLTPQGGQLAPKIEQWSQVLNQPVFEVQ